MVTLGVHYDAVAHSYTLTYPRSSLFETTQTFTPADIQPSVDPNLVYYRHSYQSPSKLLPEYDTLFLTKNSAATTLYVGAGVSLRAWDGTLANHTYSVTAFNYGIPTLDAAVPRAGTAHFDVALIGAYSHDDFNMPTCGPPCDSGDYFTRRLAGTGGIDVNFATGVLGLAGTAQEYNRATGLFEPAENFSGTATLAALTNNFSGAFTYGTTKILNGSWLGSLYGPNAEEIGATFYADANGTRGSLNVTGAIIGKRGAITTIGAAGMPFTYGDYGAWNGMPAGVPSVAGPLFPGPAGSISPAADAVSVAPRAVPDAARTPHEIPVSRD